MHTTYTSHCSTTMKLVELLRPHGSNRLVLEGLSKIRSKFPKVDALGPVAVADFMDTTDADERERIERDAFERVAGLLDALGMEPFDEKETGHLDA